jgi:phosphoglucomutase
MTARTGTNPAAAYDRIAHDLGRSWYERTDAPATAAERMQLKAVTPEEIGMASLAGEKVRTTITKAPGNGASIEGVKVVADNGWFAARPSGTEDIFKIYAESFRSQAHLRQIQQDAQEAVARVLGQPVPADAA